MWLFHPLTEEQIVTGSRAELHIAPEGIALSRNGQIGGGFEASVADYDVISDISISGGRRVNLRITFADDRRYWLLRGVSRPHGEWAQYTMQSYRDLLAWGSGEEATRALGFEEIAARVRKYEDDLPLLGNLLIAQAIAHAASDMDLEPAGDSCTLRYRIDGIVFPVAKIPGATAERLLRMVKNQAQLQAHRSDITQEGRIRLDSGPGPVDLRVTIMPGVAGEKLNVRLLNPATGLVNLGQLGMSQEQTEQLKHLLAEPTGAIVFCGPGGAGKTTSIYAALSYLAAQQPARAIATIEDPVEFDIEGISQTQVGARLGFAEVLPVLLRQDPGVVMVGEVRDPETALIAMRAGMTGQLLLTTIHAAGPELVIPRLLDLELDPYMVSSALVAIISQRLLRKLCTECASACEVTAEELTALGVSEEELGGDLKCASGCPACHGTGYLGRTGIFDLTVIDDDTRRRIMARDFAAIRASVASDALRTEAIARVKAGVTDVAEVIRVLGAKQ
jgi:type II secretory ATPase GspE/PulE/Tfp pilus assembly ATPase PilB-like protein